MKNGLGSSLFIRLFVSEKIDMMASPVCQKMFFCSISLLCKTAKHIPFSAERGAKREYKKRKTAKRIPFHGEKEAKREYKKRKTAKRIPFHGEKEVKREYKKRKPAKCIPLLVQY